jgi:hypothetical protein
LSVLRQTGCRAKARNLTDSFYRSIARYHAQCGQKRPHISLALFRRLVARQFRSATDETRLARSNQIIKHLLKLTGGFAPLTRQFLDFPEQAWGASKKILGLPLDYYRFGFLLLPRHPLFPLKIDVLWPLRSVGLAAGPLVVFFTE